MSSTTYQHLLWLESELDGHFLTAGGERTSNGTPISRFSWHSQNSILQQGLGCDPQSWAGWHLSITLQRMRNMAGEAYPVGLSIGLTKGHLGKTPAEAWIFA